MGRQMRRRRRGGEAGGAGSNAIQNEDPTSREGWEKLPTYVNMNVNNDEASKKFVFFKAKKGEVPERPACKTPTSPQQVAGSSQ